MSVEIKPDFDRLIKQLSNKELQIWRQQWSNRRSSISEKKCKGIGEEMERKREKNVQ